MGYELNYFFGILNSHCSYSRSRFTVTNLSSRYFMWVHFGSLSTICIVEKLAGRRVIMLKEFERGGDFQIGTYPQVFCRD
jgi:hypothetical protein